MNEVIEVIKLNVNHQETWRYSGEVLYREPEIVLLQAIFNRDDIPFHGIFFARGDRMVEAFYSDRWYNIFELHDREDDHLKGWYCNVCLPAVFKAGSVSYVDLALDLLVYSDGRQLVLDEDEFVVLPVEAAVRAQARAALIDLQARFQQAADFRLEPGSL